MARIQGAGFRADQHSSHHRARRYVAGDHGIGADHRAVADGHAGQHGRAAPDPNVAADEDRRGLSARTGEWLAHRRSGDWRRAG